MKRIVSTSVTRVLISVALLVHFTAVLIAAFGTGTHSHPAPIPLEIARDNVCGYLRFLQLDVPWHFYAPNPGPDSLLYVRVATKKGRVVWREWPESGGSRFCESYVRRLGYAGMAAEVVPTPDKKSFDITPRGEALLGSFVRRISKALTTELDADDTPTSIGVYKLSGDPMAPGLARAGWEFGDLRLYDAISAGQFTASGQRLRSIAPRAVPVTRLVDRIVQSIADTPDERTRTPAAVRRLLEDHADWLEKDAGARLVAIESYWKKPGEMLADARRNAAPKKNEIHD